MFNDATQETDKEESLTYKYKLDSDFPIHISDIKIQLNTIFNNTERKYCTTGLLDVKNFQSLIFEDENVPFKMTISIKERNNFDDLNIDDLLMNINSSPTAIQKKKSSNKKSEDKNKSKYSNAITSAEIIVKENNRINTNENMNLEEIINNFENKNNNNFENINNNFENMNPNNIFENLNINSISSMVENLNVNSNSSMLETLNVNSNFNMVETLDVNSNSNMVDNHDLNNINLDNPESLNEIPYIENPIKVFQMSNQEMFSEFLNMKNEFLNMKDQLLNVEDKLLNVEDQLLNALNSNKSLFDENDLIRKKNTKIEKKLENIEEDLKSMKETLALFTYRFMLDLFIIKTHKNDSNFANLSNTQKLRNIIYAIAQKAKSFTTSRLWNYEKNDFESVDCTKFVKKEILDSLGEEILKRFKDTLSNLDIEEIGNLYYTESKVFHLKDEETSFLKVYLNMDDNNNNGIEKNKVHAAMTIQEIMKTININIIFDDPQKITKKSV